MTPDLTRQDFEFLSRLLRQESGLSIDRDKAYLITARLTPLAARCDFESVAELVRALRIGDDQFLVEAVVAAMATNETAFFRDKHPFDTIQESLLPEILSRRESSRSLRFWSGACSTGQEAYSLAMIVRQHVPRLGDWDVRIVASDLSESVLDKARSGCYTQLEVNRGLPAPLLVRYFEQNGLEWNVVDELREMIVFQRINLIKSWPQLPKMDLILLRNVLIYMKPPEKKTVLARIRSLLDPDGYLILGCGETTLRIDDAFERIQFERSGCYRLRR